MQNFSVQDFLEKYVKKIVKYPDQVAITSNVGKHSDYMICIQVANEDIGKIIGKDGKMVSALKNVISACKAKDNISYELVVASNDSTKSQ
ncbi:KH domain-containing protein [Helicobacter trogontum]|uniref:KH domain-containing protein n=1 Tax=Helicobacter trogontum TaxID=50960 RepID=A0A099VE58_9HELI|nr:KH domain-containing protein [Helicobacter trogontum]MCI5787096.1 KH domain-containing protein [Helicobacter trogontum]MDY5184698.1 KH domain-containing protein [Helicobacter trogontum]TLD84634.1 KH domain-containing protein [Helicobacter trogontum]TLD97916.1 KH domain-containing protein [Helicobacter trogontum]